MMQVDGFGAETNEPNTKFKWGGSTQIPWYIKWALETLQWKYGTIPLLNPKTETAPKQDVRTRVKLGSELFSLYSVCISSGNFNLVSSKALNCGYQHPTTEDRL
jgi:hypothetical protein